MAITTTEAQETINLIQATSKTDIISTGGGLFKFYGDKLDAVFLALKGGAYGDDEAKAHFFHTIRTLSKEIMQEENDWKVASALFTLGEADSKTMVSLIKGVYANQILTAELNDKYIKVLQDIFA